MVKRSIKDIKIKKENNVEIKIINKRIRRPPERLSSHTSQEEKLIKTAMENSRVEIKRENINIPLAKIYYPTIEEFKCPMEYIRSIQKEASITGICKIIPPNGWNPTFAIDLNDDKRTFETRLQRIHKLEEGKNYDDGDIHTVKSFKKRASDFQKKWYSFKNWDKNTLTSEDIEKEYWRIVETGEDKVEVEYANDLDTTEVGSGFYKSKSIDNFDTDIKGYYEVDFKSDDYYRNCGWNLNNTARWPGSLIRHIRTPINGVNIPWLYCGMLFASFCWHNEDNYMYSINYMHIGAKKHWYGISAEYSDAFEKAMKKSKPLRFRQDPDLLLHLITMMSPSTIIANKIPVYKVVQNPGEIVITFPRAYHAGFSEGFNCNEAVNFALPEWLAYGRDCIERYRSFGRLSVFSHDRFILHLSESLHEFDKQFSISLLNELEIMFEEEVRLRDQLRHNGIINAIQVPLKEKLLTDKTMKEDDRRQCRSCRHNCFFSGIICSCNSTKISCLRHYEQISFLFIFISFITFIIYIFLLHSRIFLYNYYLCSCPHKNKYFLLWFGLEELNKILQYVGQHIKTFKIVKTHQNVRNKMFIKFDPCINMIKNNY